MPKGRVQYNWHDCVIALWRTHHEAHDTQTHMHTCTHTCTCTHTNTHTPVETYTHIPRHDEQQVTANTYTHVQHHTQIAHRKTRCVAMSGNCLHNCTTMCTNPIHIHTSHVRVHPSRHIAHTCMITTHHMQQVTIYTICKHNVHQLNHTYEHEFTLACQL